MNPYMSSFFRGRASGTYPIHSSIFPIYQMRLVTFQTATDHLNKFIFWKHFIFTLTFMYVCTTYKIYFIARGKTRLLVYFSKNRFQWSYTRIEIMQTKIYQMGLLSVPINKKKEMQWNSSRCFYSIYSSSHYISLR